MSGGLTTQEVAARVADGRVNVIEGSNTRTWGQIIRANVVTRFNMILGALLAVILVVGPLNDALFGFVLAINIVIGIVQEVRSKATLDRLAVLNAPKAEVIRNGQRQQIAVEEVVEDDVLWLSSGQQLVVDGAIIDSVGLEIDESMLTGEADSIRKVAGDQALSGSAVVAGTGTMVATRVGNKAYAAQLATEAKRFELVNSELRRGIDTIITWVGWAMIPTAALLIWSQQRAHEDWREALRSTVGGLVAMLPEGLALLTSLAFAAGIIRLGRRKALVQELAAVETLARVDVLCLDKTGTITSGDISFVKLDLVGTANEQFARRILTSMAVSDPAPNPTLRSFADLVTPEEVFAPSAIVPFSSARKWGAADFATNGAYLLGAPEFLLAACSAGDRLRVAERMAPYTSAANRVVLLAQAPDGLTDDVIPHRLKPVALGILEDRVRPDAHATLAWFIEQGVALKVISGDNPATVGAIAERAGIVVDEAVDMRTVSDADLPGVVVAGNVFGRVTPEQKRSMVNALKAEGYTVAMTGDGVNDVLALKDADMGIAMGNGSDASRATAQLVLLDSKFSSLPATVSEGRRVINNIERVAKLFVTKTVYAVLIAFGIGVSGAAYPFLPRHLTLIGTWTIGVPAFFLALEPNDHKAIPGFVRRVMHFALPSGIVGSVCALSSYAILLHAHNVSLREARTGTTLVLVIVGVGTLARVAPPLTRGRIALLVGDVIAIVAVFAVPFPKHFFALDLPRIGMSLRVGAIGIIGAAIVLALGKMQAAQKSP